MTTPKAAETLVKITAVPEISIDKHRDTALQKNDIWAPGEFPNVKTIPEAESPEILPKKPFTCGVTFSTGSTSNGAGLA